MVLSQGLGGGEIVLSAANIVLAVDASKTSWRSSSLAVILVAQTLPIWFATVTGFEPGKSLLIAQACWIIYLSYLALFIREAPHPTDTPITPSADRMESDSEAENLEPRVRSQTHQSLSKATVEPIKLFFREGNSSLVWIGVVTFVVPMAEHFCWRYGITSSVAYHLPFGYNVSASWSLCSSFHPIESGSFFEDHLPLLFCYSEGRLLTLPPAHLRSLVSSLQQPMCRRRCVYSW